MACAVICPPADAATGKLDWRFYMTPNPEGKPDGAASDEVPEQRRQVDMVRRGLEEIGRRRHAAGTRSSTTPRPISSMHGHRQRRAVDTTWMRSEGKGDNLFLSSILALEARYRRLCLALPDHPGRHLGLYRHPADHDRRPDHRRARKRHVVMQAPKNGFFYVLDREDRRADLRRQICALGELGLGRRPEDRAADRDARRALGRQRREQPDSRTDRRAQLEADGLQPEGWAGLYPGAGRQLHLYRFAQSGRLSPDQRGVEPGHRRSGYRRHRP